MGRGGVEVELKMSGYSQGVTEEATSRSYGKTEETDSTKVSKNDCAQVAQEEADAQVDQEEVDAQGYQES